MHQDDRSRRIHAFMPGLRFDRGLEMQVRSRNGGGTWRSLPTQEVDLAASGWVALMQAEAILGVKEAAAPMLRQGADAALPGLTPGDFLTRMSALSPNLSARWHPKETLLEVDDPLAKPSIACLMGDKGLSWALLTGVEITITGGRERSTALLLLDARMPAPWAAGYNARLMLETSQWRGPDGEFQSAELLGLMALCRRGDEPP